jgi:hypothetical protein
MQSTAAVTTSPDHRKQRRGKSDVHLDVANLALSDDLLKGLIDDWIVPRLSCEFQTLRKRQEETSRRASCMGNSTANDDLAA